MSVEEVISALRKSIAAGPTPGQWTDFRNTSSRHGVFDVHAEDDGRNYIVFWTGFENGQKSKKQSAANSRYIATANPENVQILLDEIDRLRSNLAVISSYATSSIKK